MILLLKIFFWTDIVLGLMFGTAWALGSATAYGHFYDNSIRVLIELSALAIISKLEAMA